MHYSPERTLVLSVGECRICHETKEIYPRGGRKNSHLNGGQGSTCRECNTKMIQKCHQRQNAASLDTAIQHHKRWDGKDIEFVCDAYLADEPVAEIARAVGRTLIAVRSMLRVQGVKKEEK